MSALYEHAEFQKFTISRSLLTDLALPYFPEGSRKSIITETGAGRPKTRRPDKPGGD